MKAKKVFEILMHDNADMLSTYLYSLVGTKDLVDDFFQETMVIAWQKLDIYDNKRPFPPWLRGIARNLVLNHYRKHRREMLMCNDKILDYLDQQFSHIDSCAGDTWGAKVDALNDCLKLLPDSLYSVIQLRYYSDIKTADLATHLNISREAIKKRLQRGKAALAECLKRRGTLVSI